MNEKFSQLMATVIFFTLFIGLLSLVGNPAKEETSIVFIISLVSAVFSYIKLGGNAFKNL